jgi:hypothetical protein
VRAPRRARRAMRSEQWAGIGAYVAMTGRLRRRAHLKEATTLSSCRPGDSFLKTPCALSKIPCAPLFCLADSAAGSGHVIITLSCALDRLHSTATCACCKTRCQHSLKCSSLPTLYDSGAVVTCTTISTCHESRRFVCTTGRSAPAS